MKIKVQFKRGVKGKKAAVPTPVKIPRIAKLMALAIHFDQLIRDGKVRDQAEIAELGHVSRPRLTQVMNLLALAPDIQESLLFLANSPGSRLQPTERHLRLLTAMPSWQRQRSAGV